MTRELFIGGKWVAARSGRTLDCVDPATGEILAEEGKSITRDNAKKIENCGIRGVYIIAEDKKIKVNQLLADLCCKSYLLS